jgi:hypothetical protein
MDGARNFRAMRQVVAFLILLLFAIPTSAKIVVDFDPGLDFSKYKTFAYIGGVDSLVSKQLNPDLIKNRVHASATRELVKKGLREVQPDENPDLVVRYWANSQTQLVVGSSLNWGVYSAYIGSYWAFTYYTVEANAGREGSLQIDLIDAHRKDLAWRLYIIRKIINVDKIWKQVDGDIVKGFNSFPPSAKEVADKQKERAEHKPNDE